MILEELGQLLALTGQGKPKGKQRDEALARLRALKGAGFTNKELVLLIGGTWEKPTMKVHMRNVEVGSVAEKIELMEVLAEFARLGGDVEETKYYNKTRALLKSEDVEIKDVVDVIKYCRAYDAETSAAVETVRQLSQRKMSPEQVKKGLELLDQLNGNGFNVPTLLLLSTIVSKLGSAENVFSAISQYESLQKMQENIREMHQEFVELDNEIKAMDVRLQEMGMYYKVAAALMKDHGFTLDSLKTIMEVARKYGDAMMTLEAVNQFNRLSELAGRVNEVQAEIVEHQAHRDMTRGEAEAMEARINEDHRKMGEIQERQRHSWVLQDLADLIDNPAKAEITAANLRSHLILVLRGALSYMEATKITGSKWPIVKMQIKSTVDELAVLET